MEMPRSIEVTLTVLAVVVFGVVLPICQLVAAVQGINHEWGGWWAWGAVFLAFAFRFTLPLVIGAFFGATEVWGWHWAFGVLFAAPGLLLMVPGVLGALAETLASLFKHRRL